MTDQSLPSLPADSGWRLTRDDAIAQLWLNRPQAHNAITLAMWEALPDIMAELADAPAVKVVLLRAAGDGTFSAGADIGEFESVFATTDGTRRFTGAVRAGFDAVMAHPKPTLAMIGGACVGGGCGLALACDLRFAAPEARFGLPPSRLGLAYDYADTKRLVETVGASRARDMLYSGRLVDATEALAIGLIDRLIPRQRLEGDAMGYLGTLCAGSQYAIQTAKAAIAEAVTGTSAPSPALAARIEASYGAEDFREGYRAFLEKRRPHFAWTPAPLRNRK